MKVPFICNKCGDVKKHKAHHIHRECGCGGKMEIDYQDNYEEVIGCPVCNTCIHNTVGIGEKCNYCNRI